MILVSSFMAASPRVETPQIVAHVYPQPTDQMPGNTSPHLYRSRIHALVAPLLRARPIRRASKKL